LFLKCVKRSKKTSKREGNTCRKREVRASLKKVERWQGAHSRTSCMTTDRRRPTEEVRTHPAVWKMGKNRDQESNLKNDSGKLHEGGE